VTAEHIKRAAAALKTARPVYEEILEFYEKLCLAQEASKENIVLEPMEIPEDILAIKRKEGFPLISTKAFAIDTEASEALLKALCGLAGKANEVLARTGNRFLETLKSGTLDASTLFSKILDDDGPFWDEAAKKAEIPAAVLAFMTYSSVRPSLSLRAEQMATCLDKEAQWKKGYCPVCGNAPALAMLRDEGQRFLLCGFCGHEWTAIRVFCPFCENKNQKKLHYFYSDQEKEYRVHACLGCKKYIKTVDVRNLTRPVHPFLEQVSTLHLDMLAEEQGLMSGLPLWLQT
jgi:FdhE protein